MRARWQWVSVIGLLLTVLNHQPTRLLNLDRQSATVVPEGKTFHMTDETGRTHPIKITDVVRDPNDPEGDIYLYTLWVQTKYQWQPLCQPDRHGKNQAIPLGGTWDASGAHHTNKHITFACTNGVLAKCVQWGYKPWKTVNGQSLQPYHQACTRMARADYCGNGISHTREGTPIEVYDRLGIQRRSPHSDMVLEAAWAPSGAVALNRTRYPNTLNRLFKECPEKMRYLSKHDRIRNSVLHVDANDALIINRSGFRQQSLQEVDFCYFTVC